MENKNLTAVNGLKLIRTAQILSIIAAILGVVGGMLALSGIVVAGGTAMESETVAAGALAVGGIGALIVIGGLVIALVSFIMQLVGLGKAAPAHSDYKTAMFLILANIVLLIASFFARNIPILDLILQMAATAAVFLCVYFVLNATIALLREKNDEATAAKGATVRVMYLVCTAIGLLAMLVSACPVLTGVADATSTIGSAVQLVALFLYLSFLARSIKSLAE